ncbi:MAG TPA: helix-turn-helix transcriptional regulator [Actinokineospora sp.]|jgi:transcriptional regulator with XRE-family HTH domain|nr:helix-turn-helix transcriptional regulator [Actinokineospora sp.]
MRITNRAGGRELGKLLKDHREQAGLTLRELADLVGWSPAHLCRLEAGNRGPATETEVVHFLACCGVSFKEVRALAKFCREANDRMGYWLCPAGPWMSDSLRSFIFHEATATRVVDYAPEVIPGVLQTEPYIQALFRREDIPDEGRQARVDARLERQKLLFRNQPAKFTFIMNEKALRLEVGNYRVMAEQLLAMMFFADQRNISIRVVPTSARHTALFGGPFIYLDYERNAPLVYLEHALGGSFVEEDDYVSAMCPLIRQVAKVALNEGESRLLIARLADEYDRAEGDWDDSRQVAQEQL